MESWKEGHVKWCATGPCIILKPRIYKRTSVLFLILIETKLLHNFQGDYIFWRFLVSFAFWYGSFNLFKGGWYNTRWVTTSLKWTWAQFLANPAIHAVQDTCQWDKRLDYSAHANTLKVYLFYFTRKNIDQTRAALKRIKNLSLSKRYDILHCISISRNWYTVYRRNVVDPQYNAVNHTFSLTTPTRSWVVVHAERIERLWQLLKDRRRRAARR